MAMATNILLPIRIVQAVLALIVLGISAYFVHWWYSPAVTHYGGPSRMSFLVFTSVWTLFALAYLVLAERFIPRLAHRFVIIAVEALTMLFWFAGWVAVAAWLGDENWAGTPRRTATAAAVFGAFEWLAFAATFALASLNLFRNRGSSNVKTAHTTTQPAYV